MLFSALQGKIPRTSACIINLNTHLPRHLTPTTCAQAPDLPGEREHIHKTHIQLALPHQWSRYFLPIPMAHPVLPNQKLSINALGNCDSLPGLHLRYGFKGAQILTAVHLTTNCMLRDHQLQFTVRGMYYGFSLVHWCLTGNFSHNFVHLMTSMSVHWISIRPDCFYCLAAGVYCIHSIGGLQCKSYHWCFLEWNVHVLGRFKVSNSSVRSKYTSHGPCLKS